MIQRFFSEGLRDAERRLGRLTAGVPLDHPRLVDVITASGAVGLGARVFAFTSRAGSSSAVVAAASRGAEWWRGLGSADQRLALGVVLFTAAAVHVALVMGRGDSPGWLWAILPGIAAAAGCLLVGASGFFGSGKVAHR